MALITLLGALLFLNSALALSPICQSCVESGKSFCPTDQECYNQKTCMTECSNTICFETELECVPFDASRRSLVVFVVVIVLLCLSISCSIAGCVACCVMGARRSSRQVPAYATHQPTAQVPFGSHQPWNASPMPAHANPQQPPTQMGMAYPSPPTTGMGYPSHAPTEGEAPVFIPQPQDMDPVSKNF